MTKLRSLAVVLGLSAFSAIGCSAGSDEFASDEGPDTTDQAMVDVLNSPVKRQSIGNCWIYATASWAESINLAATGSALNLSESYWSYWHWFDEITRGYAKDEVETGGSFEVASAIIRNYGLMTEGDFIPEEANAEMSARQHSALDAINASLKSGALKDSTARRDRALVRKELDKAWGLGAGVTQQLDAVFGKDVSKNLRSSRTITSGTKVMRPTQFKVKYANGSTGSKKTTTMNVALGEWRSVSYPTWDTTSRRNFQIRFQKALGDAQPVIVSWFVDFNALNENAEFKSIPATPGRQGGHMTVMEDTQVKLADGTLLKAGVAATPEQLKSALDPKAKVEFVRIKNSWGSYRPDRWANAVMPGFHDLYMTYLDGPVKHCTQVNGTSDPKDCYDDVPLNDVVLPPGY